MTARGRVWLLQTVPVVRVLCGGSDQAVVTRGTDGAAVMPLWGRPANSTTTR